MPEAAALAEEVADFPPDEFAEALAREAASRFDRLVSGLLRYREAPLRRAPPAARQVWQEGSTRLLDHGDPADRSAVTLLLVPSLVNRSYVLDLLPDCSFVRDLAALGIRPLLLDWGAPGPEERAFDLTAYISRLERAHEAAMRGAGGPVSVAGYCMGGVLAVALATRRPGDVAALALLAAPWDFHAAHRERALLTASCLPMVEPVLDALGELPVDVLQTLFWALDPLQAVRKFMAFADLDAASPAAERFIALEDWVNDGVPLAGPVARECLGGWYGRNDTAERRWIVGGEAVDPRAIASPALVCVPHRDRIVPPASAAALAAAIPGSTLLRPQAGHIGMVVGGRAREQVAVPLAAWLRRQVT